MACVDLITQPLKIDGLICSGRVAVVMSPQALPGNRDQLFGQVEQADAPYACAQGLAVGLMIGFEAFVPTPFFNQIPGG